MKKLPLEIEIVRKKGCQVNVNEHLEIPYVKKSREPLNKNLLNLPFYLGPLQIPQNVEITAS